MRFWGRDPLEQLIAQESMTCKGCAHGDRLFETRFCAIGKKYGRRCKSYLNPQERTASGRR